MTIPELECCLCASVMDEPTAKLGPNICTALSYSDMWESPEATKVAEGIKRAISAGNLTQVKSFMGSDYVHWLQHKSFTQGLPMSSMEPEALTLVKHYRNKQIAKLIYEAYYQLPRDYGASISVATKLWEQLGELLCK